MVLPPRIVNVRVKPKPKPPPEHAFGQQPAQHSSLMGCEDCGGQTPEQVRKCTKEYCPARESAEEQIRMQTSV